MAISDKKILLVEDSPTERQLMLRLLEDQNLIVHSIAGDLQEAYRLMEKTDFDVMILDVVLPDWSGISDTKALAHHAIERGTIVVLHTVFEFLQGLRMWAKDEGLELIEKRSDSIQRIANIIAGAAPDG